MLKLKTCYTEKVQLDDITFEIKALSRDEFIEYSRRINEFFGENEGRANISPEFYDLMLEIIEAGIDVKDPQLKETILEKIRNAPIAVQNALFDRILKLSSAGK